MGAWGTGIFESDAACDTRDLAMELLSLGLDPARVRAEIEQDLGLGDDQADPWLSLALTQHKVGRPDEGVRDKALRLIDSGRALQEWIDSVEPGDRSIKARERHLKKARDTLAAPAPKPKRLKPSEELLSRIDRSYEDFPWRRDGLYAYRIKERCVVFAAIAVQAVTQDRHYRTTSGGYELAPRPVLTEAVLLLLDYRGSSIPTAAEARLLDPFVMPGLTAEQERMLRFDEARRKVLVVRANETFEEFEQRTHEMLGHFTPKQLGERYEFVVANSRKQLALLANPQRHSYKRYSVSAREGAPLDRLIDLGAERQFDTTDASVDANTRTDWSGLDSELTEFGFAN